MGTIEKDMSAVRAPLVIGVSGHRDLRSEDREILERRVRTVFRLLRKKYPYTPLLLLSPLAEGADRLVARVALETQEDESSSAARASLVVPLPMPKELYENDFVLPNSNAPRSLEEFRQLLGQARSHRELDLAPGNTEIDIRQQGPKRDLQYRAIGRYIAHQSQILLALWDGVETGLVGGTADVVQLQLEGISEEGVCQLEPPEKFPVYHVLTPRKKNPNPKGEHRAVLKLFPKHNLDLHGFPRTRENLASESNAYYTVLFGRTDEFNRDVATDPRLHARAEKSMVELLSLDKEAASCDREDPELQLSKANLSAEQRSWLERYGFADALAIRFQRKTNCAHIKLHLVVFVAFLSFVLFAHLPQREPVGSGSGSCLIYGARIIFLVLSLLLVVWALIHHRHNVGLDIKYQDYRALAEALRIKFFWTLAGINDEIVEHYLGKQRTELDWIRNGLRGWDVSGPPRDSPSPNDQGGSMRSINLVYNYWIIGQQKYFAKASEHDSDRSEHLEKIVKWAIGSAVTFALVALVLTLLDQVQWSVDIAIILADLSLAAGALCHHYGHTMAFDEHHKQYGRMEAIYGQASNAIAKAISTSDGQAALDCLRRLGKAALNENGDWVLLHRERPLEIPHP